MRHHMRQKSWRLALCALMAALGAALLTAGGLIPIATDTTPLFAALLLLPVLEEFGTGAGWMVWAVTALLALMLSFDREAAALYCTVGFYPMLKPAFDRLRPPPLSILAKSAFFAAAQGVMAVMLWALMGPQALQAAWSGISRVMQLLLCALLVAVLLVWDRLLDRMRWFYVNRLRPKLPRLGSEDRKEVSG